MQQRRFGVGAHTAAELLIVFGDNPDRIRSEAAFAKLCGACPLPASSGMTTPYGAKKRPRLGRCWSSLPSSLRLCRLRCSSSSSRSLAG